MRFEKISYKKTPIQFVFLHISRAHHIVSRILKLRIYEFQCYYLHLQHIRINKQISFTKKNRRFVLSKFVKLYDELANNFRIRRDSDTHNLPGKGIRGWLETLCQVRKTPRRTFVSRKKKHLLLLKFLEK